MYICTMKRVLVYFLVTCFLSGSALTEVFKVPLLVSHYIDHVSRNPKINFVDFLAMHYWGNDILDHDGNQDMKLPFKKIFQGHHQLLFCDDQNFELIGNRVCISDDLYFFYLKKEISTTLVKPYRPPQFSILV